MKATLPLLSLGALLVLSACSKKADEPEATASTQASDETSQAAPIAEPTGGDAAPEPTATSPAPPVVTPTSASASASALAPSPSTSEPVAATEIPASIRGRWGLVAKDCTSKLGDAKGLLTVSASQLKFYEAVAKLGTVKEAEQDRIRATFKYSGEGQTWTQDVVLDVQDGGKTMIRRDYGPDALPGPQKYSRCV